jgi:hypothetical protein
VEVTLVSDDLIVRRHGGQFPPVRIMVVQDRRGSCFLVQRRWTVTVNVAQVDPAARQLLLVADHFRYGPERYSRFLCGHDGCAWFATALPACARVWTVQAAREALMPRAVSDEMRELAHSLA